MDVNRFRGAMASALAPAGPSTQVPRGNNHVPRPPPRLYSVPSRSIPRHAAARPPVSNVPQGHGHAEIMTPTPSMRLKRKAGEPINMQESPFSPQPLSFTQPPPTHSTPYHATKDALLVDLEDPQDPQDTQHHPTSTNSRHRVPSMPSAAPSTSPSKRLKTAAPPCSKCRSLQIQLHALQTQVQDLKTEVRSYQDTQGRYQEALRAEREVRRGESQKLRLAQTENEQLKDRLADLKDALDLSRARMAMVKRAVEEDEAAGTREEEQEEKRMAEVVPSSQNEESLSLD